MNGFITVYVMVMLGTGDAGLIDVGFGRVYPTKQECQQAVAEFVQELKKSHPNFDPFNPSIVPACAAKQVPTNGLQLE
jgi:hypothetical protein